MLSNSEIWKVPFTVIGVTACLVRYKLGKKRVKERIDQVHIHFVPKVRRCPCYMRCWQRVQPLVVKPNEDDGESVDNGSEIRQTPH